jgi:hypothetical protein
MDDTEQERLKSELDERGAAYFEGDDTDAEAPSVRSAYESALNTLSDEGIVDRAQQTMDYAETFEALDDLVDFAEVE